MANKRKLAYAAANTALVVVGSAATIAKMGQPRKPITPPEAIIVIALNVLFTAGLWWVVLS